MKRRWLLLLLFCVVQTAFVSTLFGQATRTTIRTNGPTSARINLVYLSEGYTTAQLPQFLVDVTNTMNKLLTVPPWSAYSNYFNVFAISVASVQSGSDHYTPTTNLVNTYFNSTFDSYGTQRLLTIPPNDRDGNYNDGYGKVVALLQQFLPEYDVAGLIVNDTVYGGSGGQYLLASVNSASGEIANHEIGHTFAKLGDEYSTAYTYPDVEEPNTTTNATAGVKWSAWILPTTLIPTPDVSSNYAVVGCFQGAHYHATGWYRPKHDCKMRTLGVAYCEVCAQELVLSFYRALRPIQGSSPASTNFFFGAPGTAAAFNISILKPPTNNLTVQWFTNGVAVGSATETNFSITAAQLAPGITNEVKVVVHDPTGYVRTDPTSKLWQTNIWKQFVMAAPGITNPKRTGTNFTLSVASVAGFNYVLEFKNTLTDPSWTAIQTNHGTGGFIALTNIGSVGPSRFYHVRVQP